MFKAPARLWPGWKRIARRVADVQARMLLSFFYFVILAPFAVVARMTGDALATRNGRTPARHRRAEVTGSHVDLAKRQFCMQLQQAIGRLFYWAMQPGLAVARHLVDFLTSPHVAFLVGEPTFWLLGMRGWRRKNDLSQVKRVLVVRLDQIGDVMLTTPFLRELRRNLPNAWITLVVKPAVHNLVELCPYANEVLTYDWSVSGSLAPLQRHWRALRLAYCYLWSRHFDLAIVPRWDADLFHGTFVAFFSGARWRVGYSENVNQQKQQLNGSFDRLFTHVLNDKTLRHEVEHNLDVIRFLGGTVQEQSLELWFGEEDEAFVGGFLKSQRVHPDDLLIAFGPGARAPRKMWPLPNFVEMGAWLKKEYRARIVVVGGRGEEPLGQEIQRHLGDTAINVVGYTTLRQAGALLKRCHLYIGNDAGPSHLAAAAGVPVVVIFGHPAGGSLLHSNSPSRFAPWGGPHRVLQPEKALAPCREMCASTQAHCIRGVTVEQVKEVIEARLSERECFIARKRALEYAD
jgi:ADP-heptose:LPS heptosyltransferase